MLKTAKVVGLNSDTDAALALVTSCLLVIVACEAEDAFSKIRQALAEADNYFYSTEESISQRMPKCLDLIKEQLQEAADVQILLASVQEDINGTVLYLIGSGDRLKANLARHHQITNLLDTGERGLISGVFLEGDRLILFTPSLQDLLGGSLEKVASLPIDTVEDEIGLLMPEAQVNPLACIVLEREITPKGEILKPLEQGEIDKDYESRIKNNDSEQKEKAPFISVKLPVINPKVIAGAFIILLLIGAGFFGFKKITSRSPTPQTQANVAAAPQIQNVYQVSDFALWLDLDLVKKGFKPSNISLSFGKLLSLDLKNQSLVALDTGSKTQQILAGEDKVGKGEKASLISDQAFVYSGDKGVIKVDTENKKAEQIIKKDDAWGNIADIFGFGGNVYLLDSSTGQIWKYLPTEAGYSDKREYLKEKADLKEAKKMQIDSSVWILKRGGDILKFTQGAQDHFAISGLDKDLKDVNSFYITDQTDNIYLLDSGNNRLVVLDKTGKYQAQYQSPQFANFSDLVVDEGKKKVFLLQGSKIYTMELK